MADQKISGLPNATTPVAGTEVLPIVQGGNTVKVSIGNLTAGRSISTAGASLDGAVVINESGANVDVRVEGDAEQNLLFIDASADSIGMGGVTTPNARLHVKSAAAATPAIKTESTSVNGYAVLGDYYVAGQSLFQIGIGYSLGDLVVGHGVGPSTTVQNAYVSTQNQSSVHGVAFTMDAIGGTFKILNGATSSTVAPGSARTLTERITINPNDMVFNDPGVNYDVRMEGDTDPNLFFVDASVDKVGFGTGSPNEKVEISGNLRFSGSQTGNKIQQRHTAVSVTTSATTIHAPGDIGAFVVVNGDDGSNRFCDLVMASPNTAPTVVQSYTSLGTPAARTYTRSGTNLQLAMASGTYNIYVLALGY
jgi:hypothetical protein